MHITKLELSTGKSLYKQSQVSEETFINIKCIPAIHSIFCLSNSNKLYLILSPPYYNKSKCVLEVDLSGLGLIENSERASEQPYLQDFVVGFDNDASPGKAESEPVRVDLRDEVLKRKKNFVDYRENISLKFMSGKGLDADSPKEDAYEYFDSQRADIGSGDKSLSKRQSRSSEEVPLVHVSTVKSNLDLSRMPSNLDKSKSDLESSEKRSTRSGQSQQELTVKSVKKKRLRIMTGKKSVNRQMYKFKFSNRTKDIHSNAELNKIFDHFFVKVMEVYTTGPENPMFQVRYYQKQVEEIVNNPEKIKREMSKAGVSKLAQKIYEKACDMKESLVAEKQFTDGLFLGTPNRSAGR